MTRRTVTIIRKELLDVLRDKRTILTMVIIPLVAVPLLITVVLKISQRQQDRLSSSEIRVGVVGSEYAPLLSAQLRADPLISIDETVPENDVEERIVADSIDAGLIIPPTFMDRVDADERATVTLVFRSSSSFGVTERRLRDAIDEYDDQIVAGRIRRLQLDEFLFDAIEIETRDVSTLKEVLGRTVGGFLPYVFVLFMFTGAMYPGIDLGAGEKERGTLETLLCSPATRLEIVLGKFFVVALAGLLSAMISMLGLYLAARNVPDLPPEAMEVIWDILNLKVVAMIVTLLLPLAAFFSAVILAGSIYARSFREAQSSLTPLSFLIIFPVVIGLLPGIELNVRTAMVPILNVSLATKEVIAGTIDIPLLIVSYASLFLLAGLSLWFAVKWFSREETLFRS